MADDDTDHGDNRPENMILDEKVVKMGEELAAIFTKRKNLNLEAKNIYTNADKLGIPPAALQAGVRMVRMMDKSDRVKYQAGVRRTVRALEPVVADLYPEDVERIKKRQERAKARAEKEAKATGKESPEAQERRLAADLNPRSDPKRGGAGKGKKAAKAAPATEPTAEQKAVAEAEQLAGATILDTTIAGIPKVDADGKPLSQTAQSTAILDGLGLNK